VVAPATAVLTPAARTRPKRITILGATGSIGASTLAVIGAQPGHYAVEAVTANSNAAKLAKVARASRARLAAIADPAAYAALKEALAGSGIEAAAGPAAVVDAARRPADLVVAAIVGAAGLAPSFAALAAGTPLALANKECLVSAGDLFVRTARARGVPILPVDSEHNAIFQILDGRDSETVERIVITASGGPFRDWTAERMAAATPAEALAHPTWSMGPKITIDSATLMNKGLELVEAHHLFDVGSDRLEVLIHPQSIVHGLVAFCDGAVIAALGPADMRGPIAHCLSWPERVQNSVTRLDLAKMPALSFAAPDAIRFPALAVARAALAQGTRATNIMSAANEIAVEAFLGGSIGFLEIASIVNETLSRAGVHLSSAPLADIEEAIDLDRTGRRLAVELLPRKANVGAAEEKSG
jgi:1-deoxy-D-xylulose-5-phosphate reductoisomerase